MRLLTPILLALSSLFADAATIHITAAYFNGLDQHGDPSLATERILDQAGLPLTAGSAVNGDGAVIQIGYLAGVDITRDPALFGPAEWNSFVPLSGDGLNQEGGTTTIGDLDSGAVGPFGLFGVGLVLGDGENGNALSANLPDTYRQRLAIRLTNGTSLAASTHYNTVSSFNDEWLMNAPVHLILPTDTSILDLDHQSLVWRGTPFQTSLPIPEPSSAILMLLALSFFLRRRRG